MRNHFYLYFAFILRFCISTFEAHVKQHDFWKDYYLCYNAFDFPLPINVQNNQTSIEFFNVQQENVERPIMANTSLCGNVKIVENGSLSLSFSYNSNVTHIRTTHDAPIQGEITNESFDYALVLTGHEGRYFQHFLDNTAVTLGIAVDVLKYAGIPLQNVTVLTEKSYSDKNVYQMWERMPFKEILDYDKYRTATANHLIYVECSPRMHPDFTHTLRELIRIEHDPNPDTVYFIIRTRGNSRNMDRLVENNDAVIQLLQNMYGDNLYLFDHTQHKFEEILTLFAKAKVIIGMHGGGMYNQFFASSQASIVEIMPILETGIHSGQGESPIPPFAHMAMWIDSNMIGQRFWRYYQFAESNNCDIDLNNFSLFLLQIPELQKYLNASYLEQSKELIGDVSEIDESRNDDSNTEISQNSINDAQQNDENGKDSHDGFVNNDSKHGGNRISYSRKLDTFTYQPFYPTIATLIFYLVIFIYYSYIY